MITLALVQARWGPGPGEWTVDTPENHGLSSDKLKLAGKQLEERVALRECFVVVKDGVIVHEDYWNGATKDTPIETDSAGKTVSAALVGAVAAKGYLDVDKTLESYGVEPQASWGHYWPNITAKHLLAQTSGLGRVEPGKYFTYDSDSYIQHLSYLMTKVTPESSAFEFANKYFAKPLGIPDLYKYDDIDPEVSIGGGQMMTCRQMARVGQLILNEGKWPTESGELFEMVTPEYVKDWTSPAFPNVASTYGYLTWLNTEPTSTQCCAPRWGNSRHCVGYKLVGSIIGDDVLDPAYINAPYGVSIALGWLGKYLITIPDRNMTIVTFGESWGSSHLCDGVDGGYDDSYTLTESWRAFGNLTIPSGMTETLQSRSTKKSFVESQSQHSMPALYTPKKKPHKIRRHKGSATQNDVAHGDIVGSCYCYCPPSQGFGQCYNLNSLPRGNADNCSAVYSDGARICPAPSVVRETSQPESDANSTWCKYMQISREIKCGSDTSNNASEACSCEVQRFERCYYYPSPCDDDPYTPTNGTDTQK